MLSSAKKDKPVLKKKLFTRDEPIFIKCTVSNKDVMMIYGAEDSPDAEDCSRIDDELYTEEVEHAGMGTFNITMAYKGDDTIVECNGLVIDEWDDANFDDGADLAALAYDYDINAYESFYALQKWKMFVPKKHSYDLYRCCIYIDRLFINPEYRRMGIATFIFNNIQEIFFRKYRMMIAYACIMIASEDSEDAPSSEMREIMADALENAGFVNIPSDDNPDIYAKDFSPQSHEEERKQWKKRERKNKKRKKILHNTKPV